MMMNSQLVNNYTSSKGKTVLAELIGKKLGDEEIIEALYERVLARKPTVEEKKICLRHCGRVGDPTEALEDLLWSLVNSTEFLIKK